MELLAPCSSKETFLAALNAGADAIYLGGKQFSARANAENFTLEEIKECIEIAHAINVKIHITVNTLLFEDEFDLCFNECEKYIALGVDALIIQDLGLINKIHKTYPKFPIHASTQLNVHNVEEAIMLKKLGVSRIVLAREANLEIAKEIIAKTHLEVETFIHGALCVSCSGQCLMSSFIGGRSGNRGRCAQPCRMEGSIVSSNNKYGNAKFPLSMKDLCTIEHLEQFEKFGITSLKIEGRLKNKEYIFHTVKAYRSVLDKKISDLKNVVKDIKVSFNRGYTKGFVFNEKNHLTLNQNTSSHIGIVLGKVAKVGKNSFFIVLNEDVSLHDGLRDLNLNDGFLLTHLKYKGVDVPSAKKGSYVEIISSLKGIKVNDTILKTKSKVLENQVNLALNEIRKIPIEGYFSAKEGEFMTFTLYENDISYTAVSRNKMQKGINSFMNKNELLDRLSKSDAFPFYLNNLEFDIEPGLFYSIKELNELRRTAFEAFLKLKIEHNHIKYKKITEPDIVIQQFYEYGEIVSVEKEEQLLEVIKYPFRKVFVPENLYVRYKDSDERIHLSMKRMGKDHYKDHLSLSPYISNNSKYLSPYANITNYEALKAVMSLNYSGVILSYELSYESALKIKEKWIKNFSYNPLLYYPIYGNIIYMYLKSCPISTSFGKEEGCGLCKTSDFYYIDRKGVKYPLMTTNDCYVKVLSDKPLSLINKKDIIKKEFIPYLYFSNENSEMTKEVLEAYFNDQYENYESFLGHFNKTPL